MNRRERRRLEREGKLPPKEPVYTLKPSQLAIAAMKGPGSDRVKHEINKQLLEADKQFTLDMDTMVLSTLHHEYGWGVKRCKEFYLKMFKHHLEMRKYYEVDDLYPERYTLNEAGIDVAAWFNALFDEQGNFKEPESVNI